jgi:hypothetical protein
MSGVSIDDFLLVDHGRVERAAAEVVDARLTLQWPSRVKHLSATSLGMFRRCPEQFRHRYILGEKERPGEALIVGSIFHDALEWNYQAKIESHEDQPLADLVQYLGDVSVPKVIDENGGPDEIAWDHPDPVVGVEAAHQDSERILSAYRRRITERIQPVAVEQKFEIPGEPVPIIGYLDTCTDDQRVIDTKTGKQAVKKLKPSWRLQAVLYSTATGWTSEYHSISRAARPSIVTGLESEELIQRPDETQMRNVLASAKTIADMISYLYTTLGPDQTWPTWGRFADWSMSFTPCGNCGWRRVCPAMAGEV